MREGLASKKRKSPLKKPPVKKKYHRPEATATLSVPPDDENAHLPSTMEVQISSPSNRRTIGIQYDIKITRKTTRTVATQTFPFPQTDMGVQTECALPESNLDDAFLDTSISEDTTSTSSGELYVPYKESLSKNEQKTEPAPELLPSDDEKYLIFKHQLLKLFDQCLNCQEETQGNIIQRLGTYIKVEQKCSSCGFIRQWDSQPMLREKLPAGNLLLSGVILFSGSTYMKVSRMLALLKMPMHNESNFYEHQTRYLEPTIMQHWCFNHAALEHQTD